MAQLLSTPASNLTPDTFVGLWIELRNGRRELDEANARYRAIRKRMEKAGVNLKGLALAEQFANLEQDEADIRLREAIRYSQWAKLPLGAQPTLFADLTAQADAPGIKASHELSLAEVEEQGYAYGKRGEDRSENPHDLGTELAHAWDAGYLRGQALIAQEMARPKKPRASRGAVAARNSRQVNGSRLGV